MDFSATSEAKGKKGGAVKPANPSSGGASYPSFAQIPAGRNPENYVLINGRYYFNDYDTTGDYLRRQFGQ
jgi:hypothetical protein